MKTYIQNETKNMLQSNSNTRHFENDFGAYLPLKRARASLLISFLIYLNVYVCSLFLPILNKLFVFFFAD